MKRVWEKEEKEKKKNEELKSKFLTVFFKTHNKEFTTIIMYWYNKKIHQLPAKYHKKTHIPVKLSFK